MKLKEIWNKVNTALTRAIQGAPPVNFMNASDVQYIAQQVKDQTGFKVACQDTPRINGRKNVGLVMDQTTAPEIAAKAEDVFIAAAKERGRDLERNEIVHYVPGTEPADPSRSPYRINPPAKTW